MKLHGSTLLVILSDIFGKCFGNFDKLSAFLFIFMLNGLLYETT